LYSVGVLCLVSDPWGAPRVRSLLTGKVEQQQQVLELVSSEGVDLVLLRIGRDTNAAVVLKMNENFMFMLDLMIS
jgi:hypothetical protein